MQQINLYHSELHPRREWLTASSLGLICTGFVVMLAVSWLYQDHQNGNVELTVREFERYRMAMETRTERFEAGSPSGDLDAIDRRIVELRGEIEAQARTEPLLRSQDMGNAIGFTAQFVALARNVPDAVSLSAFRFEQEGNRAAFGGETRSPAAVLELLDRLQREESFGQTVFGQVSVTERSAAGNHRFAVGFPSIYPAGLDRLEGR